MNDIILMNTDENSTSQFTAINQLVNLGYKYLTCEEIRLQRESNSKYILKNIAFNAIRKINTSNISDKSIHDRITAIENIDFTSGNIDTACKIYNSIFKGDSVEENINGKKQSLHLNIIDFENIENNVFHVTAEFPINDGKSKRPDIVLFVNGIPFAVIENKKSSVPLDDAINQILNNQKDSDFPKFYMFTQLLIGTNVTGFMYGTYKTDKLHYSKWKENDDSKEYKTNLDNSIHKKIDEVLFNKIIADIKIKDYDYNTYLNENFMATSQDIGIFGMLQKERLLDITKFFILFDGGIKKVARYNQYFAVKKTIKRINEFDENGKRKGGVLWHTQGSGKSLTMVILAKVIYETIKNPRIFIVTDRIDLDNQIKNTFENNGLTLNIKKAKSGADLLEKIKEKSYNTIITTLVQKFDSHNYVDNDPNVFIFIDEAHRSQYGTDNKAMLDCLKNSCVIAFTGTPLLNDNKTTSKFGKLIDSYKMKDAELDGAVVRLIYQGRFAEQHIDVNVNKMYERITANFTEEQKSDFLRKYLSSSITNETVQNITTIALDIADHFLANFHNTGLKGQLVAQSKYAAVAFYNIFKEYFPELKTAVCISDDYSKEEYDCEDYKKEMVKKYLDNVKKEYGTIKNYDTKIIKDFKDNPNGIELIIVVDKLLTGFDAPRNTVLYLTKQLKDHSLMQAVARVNRVYTGDKNHQQKENGLIIDYSANAKNLQDAMALFNNFNIEDVEDFVNNPETLVNNLKNIFLQFDNMFQSVTNKTDKNEYIEYLLSRDDVREQFYHDVNKCIRVFDMCNALQDLNRLLSKEEYKNYALTLKQYIDLKKTTKLIKKEIVDFSKLKTQLSKILDTYVSADEVDILTEEIDISNSKEFNEYIENPKTKLNTRNKAEAVAAQAKLKIKEKINTDPVFYGKFSDLIDKILKNIKDAKEEDITSLYKQLLDAQEQINDHEDSNEKLPDSIKNKPYTHAYFRLLKDKLGQLNIDDIEKATLFVNSIVDKYRNIVDFEKNITYKNNTINSISDYLYDELNLKIDYNYNSCVEIAEKLWDIIVANK